MATAAALKESFTHELADRLKLHPPAELAERTGLREDTIVELCTGSAPELFSWEVISACLTAADVPPAVQTALHGHWTQVEAGLWAERESHLLRKIEADLEREKAKAGRGAFDKKAFDRRTFDVHRPHAPWRKMTGPSAGYTRWGMTDLAQRGRLPDPATATSVKQFYELLKQLHLWAGIPSANEIEYRSWGALSHSTANTMLGPTRYLQGHQQGNGLDRNNLRFLTAVFGLPAKEVDRWIEAYDQVRRLPVIDAEREAAAARAELSDEVRRREMTEQSLADVSKRAQVAAADAEQARREAAEHLVTVREERERSGALIAAARRWRTATLALAGALALTLAAAVAIPLANGGSGGTIASSVVVQFPKPYALVPGPSGVTIPLPDGPAVRAGAGHPDWAVVLRMRLAGLSAADTCVHDSRVTYRLRRRGAVIGSGSFPQGQANLSTGPLPVGPDARDLEVVLAVTVPPITGFGCEFTLDPSGTTITPAAAGSAS
jgi:hypothetical protein